MHEFSHLYLSLFVSQRVIKLKHIRNIQAS